jgi:CubicO group peptidase (beta-lactamase class C family)
MIKGLTQREGPHGEAFGYKSVVSDVLAWAMKKATGKSLAQMVSERLWSRMGAEEDGFYLLDPIGTEVAMGGFNATLRDLGRLGQLMLNKGEVGGRQLIPREVVEEIMAGGDREAFARAGMTTRPGWSYKDQWWVTHNENGAFMAMGVYGQRLYVDPKARMVIAKLGSHPVASNAFTDLVHMKAFQALAKELSH